MHKRSVCYGKFRAYRRHHWQCDGWRNRQRAEQGFLFRFFVQLKGVVWFVFQLLRQLVEFFRQPKFQLFFQQPKFRFFLF